MSERAIIPEFYREITKIKYGMIVEVTVSSPERSETTA